MYIYNSFIHRQCKINNVTKIKRNYNDCNFFDWVRINKRLKDGLNIDVTSFCVIKKKNYKFIKNAVYQACGIIITLLKM